METKNKAIVVNLLSDGLKIEEMPPKQEELNNCIDIQTQESKASLLQKIKNENNETFIMINDGDGEQEPICFRVKKECLLKVDDNVFFKMNTYSTENKQCPVDYHLEINNKDNSIIIKTITTKSFDYHTSYHDSTITCDCNLSPTKYFQILPSGDIKFSTSKVRYQTKNSDRLTFYQQRQSYLTNLRRASGFVKKTKGLMGIDIFNGSCLCDASCCGNDDIFMDDGEQISLEDINDNMKVSEYTSDIH